mmetsp:Transcript_23191/g.64807  ORF Transcript_23191/g.64807 Transcript_23191/m.64807 type:complete len:393 (+) Transcript_23191:593-1771(+)
MQTTVSATSKKSPVPPTTRTVEICLSRKSGRIFWMNGWIGSLLEATNICILWSRIMKLVAHVSSSTRIVVAPASMPSLMFAAWLVLPLASLVENFVVSSWNGRFLMNAEMSVHETGRPSSLRTLYAFSSATTNSRPSPGTTSYTPLCSAWSTVDLPWKPPPTMSVMPLRIPMPVIVPACGSVTSTSREGGDVKATTVGETMGRSSAPLARGKMAPFPTKATRPSSAKTVSRRCTWSSTTSMCLCSFAWSKLFTIRAFLPSSTNAASTVAAFFPSIVRPCAGSATVTRASTKSRVSTTEERCRTNWHGVSICRSPPLEALQPPPPETFAVQSVPDPPRIKSLKTRCMKSHTARFFVLSETYTGGYLETDAGIRSRNILGAAYASPCTWSTKIV